MVNVRHNTLSAAKVRNLSEPGVYTDGEGLTLRISKTGSKRWVQRITIESKQRTIELGPYPVVGLAEARRVAAEHRRTVMAGGDPIEKRRQEKGEREARAAIPTFREAAATVIKLRRPTWSSDRHAKQWTESLTNHSFPVIGDKRMDTITIADTLAVLTPIWTDLPETSTRVKQRMGKVFDYAIANGWRADNPVNRALDAVLPRRTRLKAHHKALPYAQVPAVLKAVRESTADLATRLSFEFAVLTVARAGEVREADWSEIDWENATWTVPAARMKARREHRVPLSDRAMALLAGARSLGDGIGPIFPSKRSGRPLSDMAFSTLLKRLGVEAVPHGFRSSFRDWVIEQTSTPWAVGEAALAHNLGNSVESAYARTDVFDRRRVLVQEWADFLAVNGGRKCPASGGENSCTFGPRPLRKSLSHNCLCG